MRLMVIASLLLLFGCQSMIEHTAEIDEKNMTTPHPRALLLQRVMPSCLWWCTNSTVVHNSEGVKAQNTTGDLSSNEAQSSSVSTQQSFSPNQRQQGAQ